MDKAKLIRHARQGHIGAIEALLVHMEALESQLHELYFGDAFTPEKLIAAGQHLAGVAAANGHVLTISLAPNA